MVRRGCASCGDSANTCNCLIVGDGHNIDVAGNGSQASPYVVSSRTKSVTSDIWCNGDGVPIGYSEVWPGGEIQYFLADGTLIGTIKPDDFKRCVCECPPSGSGEVLGVDDQIEVTPSFGQVLVGLTDEVYVKDGFIDDIGDPVVSFDHTDDLVQIHDNTIFDKVVMQNLVHIQSPGGQINIIDDYQHLGDYFYIEAHPTITTTIRPWNGNAPDNTSEIHKKTIFAHKPTGANDITFAIWPDFNGQTIHFHQVYEGDTCLLEVTWIPSSSSWHVTNFIEKISTGI